MATAQLKIEFLAGDDILSAFEEAIRIAKLLNIGVSFMFNNVECYATSNSKAINGKIAYLDQLSKKDGHKFAVA